MKKLTALLLAAIMILAAMPSSAYSLRNVYPNGDVDRDYALKIKDANLIQRYLANFIELDEDQQTLADFNLDGKINIFDVTEIQLVLCYVKQPPSEPETQPTTYVDITDPPTSPTAPTAPTYEPPTAPTAPTSEPPTTPTSPYPASFLRSSAKTIGGKTALVSIFVDNGLYSWSWDNSDKETRDSLNSKLGTACQWLTDNCADYGVSASFVYNLNPSSDLAYKARFEGDMGTKLTCDVYEPMTAFINKNISVSSIKSKYGADNVVFIMFMNTTSAHTVNPYSISHTVDEMYDNECVMLFTKYKSYTTNSTTMAHEIMHCFGAIDLYYERYVTADYIEHLKSTNSKDIMYKVYDGEPIRSVMSELDAYYIGLKDDCADIHTWNLPVAERLK